MAQLLGGRILRDNKNHYYHIEMQEGPHGNDFQNCIAFATSALEKDTGNIDYLQYVLFIDESHNNMITTL